MIMLLNHPFIKCSGWVHYTIILLYASSLNKVLQVLHYRTGRVVKYKLHLVLRVPNHA